MRTIPAGLATHYATRKTTTAHALKITRTDAAVYGFTEHDRDASISGVTYSSRPGLAVSSLDITAGLAVGNLRLTTLHDGTVFTTADVLGGVWRNAAFVIFRYNWANLSDGIDTLLAGVIGEVEIKDREIVAELRDLRQYLQQPVGSLTSKTCRYRLGSTTMPTGGLCMKDITVAPYTMPFTVTASPAPTQQVFRDAARLEAADWFGEGWVQWLTGANAGQYMKVKFYDADGTFHLVLPMWSVVAAGDTGTAVAGCRKRLEEDCRDKFDNTLNFGGEPHLPGLDALTASPGADV